MPDLIEKRAFVVGGSRGIGAAIVRKLAAEGARVTFTYASSSDAARSLEAETGATAIRSDAAQTEQLVAQLRDHPSLDILVVNAGMLLMGHPHELEAAGVDRMIDINVRAPYHAAVEAARTMPDGGRIIVIGSVNGDRMPFSGGAAYALSKAALQGMVRGLARDFGERSITVNVVQPGPVDTDMNPADGPMAELMHSFMAIKRHGTAAEVAALVSFLAGRDAGFITGSQLTVDGGFGA